MPAPVGTPRAVLTEEGVASIQDLVQEYVAAGLGDFAFAVTDLPAFLADTSPVAAAAQPTRQIVRAACRTYARGGGPQNLPGFDAIWGGICEPYLESIGEDPAPGSVARPFTGGQCYGVLYEFDFTFTNDLGDRVTTTLDSNRRIVGAATQPNAQGSISVGYRRQQSPESGVQFVATSAVSPGTDANPVISNVRRQDGSPDECGDPPPEYDPPKIRPDLPPFTPDPIDLPGIGPQPIDITFDPDGSINIGLPDVGVDFTVEDPFGLGGDEGGGGDGGPGTPPPGDVGSPGGSEDAGSGEAAEGEAPSGSVLTGVRVQVLTVPNTRTRYTSEVLRGAYYLYMGVPGLLDLDFGGAMVREDQFFFAEKDNLTSWRVRANTGYSIRATPYYREVEE